MKFNSIREMETNLKNVTSLKSLQEDITFATQGQFITVSFIGIGSSAAGQEISYLGKETADSLRINYTGNDNNITVTSVKLTTRV